MRAHGTRNVHQAEHDSLRDGLGMMLIATIAQIDGIDVGNEPTAELQPIALLPQPHEHIGVRLSQALQPGNFVLKLLQFFRLGPLERDAARHGVAQRPGKDRKSTRLKSQSLKSNSYALFCWKNKAR